MFFSSTIWSLPRDSLVWQQDLLHISDPLSVSRAASYLALLERATSSSLGVCNHLAGVQNSSVSESHFAAVLNAMCCIHVRQLFDSQRILCILALQNTKEMSIKNRRRSLVLLRCHPTPVHRTSLSSCQLDPSAGDIISSPTD